MAFVLPARRVPEAVVPRLLRDGGLQEAFWERTLSPLPSRNATSSLARTVARPIRAVWGGTVSLSSPFSYRPLFSSQRHIPKRTALALIIPLSS